MDGTVDVSPASCVVLVVSAAVVVLACPVVVVAGCVVVVVVVGQVVVGPYVCADAGIAHNATSRQDAAMDASSFKMFSPDDDRRRTYRV